MNKTRWNSVTHKATGKRYLYHYRTSWGVKYFSFDHDESTWHPTRAEAFRHSEETGNLHQLHSLETIQTAHNSYKEVYRVSEINGWPKGDY